jgi:hypothetical protein
MSLDGSIESNSQRRHRHRNQAPQITHPHKPLTQVLQLLALVLDSGNRSLYVGTLSIDVRTVSYTPFHTTPRLRLAIKSCCTKAGDRLDPRVVEGRIHARC